MSKKDDILRIWQECFPSDSREWREMFFDAAYCDDDALTLTDDDGTTASSLLLLPYAMTFHGERVGLAYVYGAGTLRKYRAKGYMGRLMKEAVTEAARRGDTFLCLIPASESLRRYYTRFGLATVGFSAPTRFTSAHRFVPEGNYVEAPIDPLQLYADFECLSAMRPCAVQHSRTQFLTVMDDARLSNYPVAAVADSESGRVVAMAWARPEESSNVLRVTELMAENTDAAIAALASLRSKCPGRPITLEAMPSDDALGGNLTPGVMVRTVHADSALAIIAASNPKLRLTVRLTDPLLEHNTGIYRLADGSVEMLTEAPRQIDLDVTPEVLTSLMFSSTAMADITGLPSQRPRLTLLLS